MKKTFKKIIICLIAIGVVFFTTPFLIKTKAYSIDDESFSLGSYSSTDGNFTYSFNVKYEPLGADYSYEYAYHMHLVIVHNNGFNEGNQDVDFNARYNYAYKNSFLFSTSYSNVSPTYAFYTDQFDGSYYILDFYIRPQYDQTDYKYIYTFLPFVKVSDSTDTDVLTFNRQVMCAVAPDFISVFTDGYNQGDEHGHSIGYQQGQTDTITNTSASSWISNIGQGVSNILAIPVFGTITIGTLVFIPIAMSVLLWLLHVWRRN